MSGAPTSPLSTPPVSAGAAARRRFRRGVGSEVARWLVVAAITLPIAAMLLVGGLVVAIYVQARSSQYAPADAIVVMGAAQYNGRPSPVLRARLDTALDAYERGLAPTVIVTGGKQPDDAFTEAGTQRDYLVARGVPEEAILLEDESRNTWQSLVGVAAIAESHGIERILIVSDGFHLFRSKLMARDVGLDPLGIASEDSPIEPGSGLEFSYVLRETAGVIVHLLTWRDAHSLRHSPSR